MPRKQRFKPSRKPKPVIPNDDATVGRPDSGSAVHNDNASTRETSSARDANSLSGVESGST
jgi:hypothetical protein